MSEQAKIIGLRAGQEIYRPDGDPDVIKELEGWLELAKSGEIVSVAGACLYRDNSLGGLRVGMKSIRLVGELFSMCARMAVE